MRRNASIEGLRFVAAWIALLWHTYSFVERGLGLNLQMLFRGEIANVIFFMLSGFFVTYGKDISKIRWPQTLRRKIRKIYPLYVCTVLYLAVVLYGWKMFTSERNVVLKHLLCIQSWFPYNNASAELNGAAWFLSCVLFYWCLTGLLLKRNFYSSKCFLAFLAIGYVVYVFAYPFMGGWFTGIWMPWPFLCYGTGLVLGSKMPAIAAKISNISTAWMECAVVILLVASILAADLKLYSPLLYGLMMLLSINIHICLACRQDGIMHKFLSLRFMQLGGALSMPMYLVHLPIVRTLYKTGFLNSMPMVQFAIVLVGTLGLSYLIVMLPLRIKVRKQA